MPKLKLAYEWIGPTGPISNNDYPSIYETMHQYNNQYVNTAYTRRDPNLEHLLSKVCEVEITPVCNIKFNDFFFYDMSHDWKHAFLFESTHSGSINPRIKSILDNDHSKGYYAFNFGIEGEFEETFQRNFYSLLKRNKINPNKVIYITGCINAQKLNDKFVKENNIDGSIKFINYMHFSSNVIDYQTLKEGKKSRSKKFICLNRRWKPHRLMLYIYLHKHKLLDNFYFSMPGNNIGHIPREFTDISLETAARYNIDIDINDIESAYNDLPLVVDSSEFSKINFPWWENDRLKPYFEDSYVSIVPETFYHESGIFPTEKIFRPMSFAHPFLVLANTGYLKELKATGVKTFSDFIDESYDGIVDDGRRLNRFLSLVREMCDWPISKFEELIDNSRNTCVDNYNLIITDGSSLMDIAARQINEFGKRE